MQLLDLYAEYVVSRYQTEEDVRKACKNLEYSISIDAKKLETKIKEIQKERVSNES
jgi:hypothetical protein